MKEAQEFCTKVGLPDITETTLTKEEIKEVVFNNRYKQMKEEMKPLEKLDLNGDLSKPQTFITDNNLD